MLPGRRAECRGKVIEVCREIEQKKVHGKAKKTCDKAIRETEKEMTKQKNKLDEIQKEVNTYEKKKKKKWTSWGGG